MGLSKQGMSIRGGGWMSSQDYNDMLRSSSRGETRYVEDSVLKNHAIHISNMMKNAPMNAVPIKLALESYRSIIKSNNSDNWILNNIIKICEPLQPYNKNKRWYVNENALKLMDWSITEKSSQLQWWTTSNPYPPT